MSNQTMFARASFLALLAATLPTYAQTQAGADADTGLQEIVVTGSLIKRTDIETPSPVQVLTDVQIAQSGYTNISQVLSTITANGQGNLSQSFNGAFASGASGVSLRGLAVGDTLVLIDGERSVDYPIEDDNERAFVDVSAIPINAVESIEVVKDNASAVYGADAMAGVVNIKLKKSYTGAEFTSEFGTTKYGDGNTEHIAGIFGTGDLVNDGYNFYVAVDYHHQAAIGINARGGAWTNTNWTSLPEGLDAAPGSGVNAIINTPTSLTGYILNPASIASGTNIGPQNATFFAGCSYAAQSLNACQFLEHGQIQPTTAQANVLAKFTKSLVNDWEFNVQGSVFDSKAEQDGNYFNTSNSLGGFTDYAYAPGQLVKPVIFPGITVPANYPGNPYGAAAPLVYSFGDPEATNIDTTTYRLLAKVGGKAFGWDLEAALGVMYSHAQERQTGYVEPGLFQDALNNGTFIIGVTPLATGAKLFAPGYDVEPSSSLGLVDLHGVRELVQLPGGPLSLAVGVQIFQKTENDLQPPISASGAYDNNAAYDEGNQDDAAAFVELQGKPIQNLEIDGSVRYDHYDTIGGDTTPKIGIKYQPIPQFAIRGTWGKGFRAPSSAEGQSSGTAFGAGQFQDPVLCANGINQKGSFNYTCEYPLTGFEANGTGLKPVTSTNSTFGVIFEPIRDINVSVDYYRIKLANDILPSFEVGGLANYTALQRGPTQPLAVCTNSVTTGTCNQVTVQTPVGTIADALYPYLNIGETDTSGFDVDFRAKTGLGAFGDLAAVINYTRILVYDETLGGVTYDLAGTHGPSGISGDTGNPRDRVTAALTWSYSKASLTVNEVYIGPFRITDPSSGIDDCATALNFSEATYTPRFNGITNAQVPSSLCTVHRWLETNLEASYVANEHVSVHGSITNVFNAQPPLDLQTYGGGGGLAYDGAFYQDGAVGRFFLVGATYKF